MEVIRGMSERNLTLLLSNSLIGSYFVQFQNRLCDVHGLVPTIRNEEKGS